MLYHLQCRCVLYVLHVQCRCVCGTFYSVSVYVVRFTM